MAWVRRFLGGVSAGGHVLDLACGAGRHARLALEQGFRVTCADRDLSGVRDLEDDDRVTLVETDLEAGGPFPFAPKAYDGIVVTNYLYRPILPGIMAAVRPDGLLIYATFAVGHLHPDGRPMRPEFLVRPGELLEAVTPTLAVVAYEHGEIEDNGRWIVQRIAAAGPEHRWAGRWPLSPAGSVG